MDADPGDADGELATRSTTDHETIRRWVEERGGRPARTGPEGRTGAVGALHIDFPSSVPGRPVQSISWEEFFADFDGQGLEFLYTDEPTAGGPSRVWRFALRGQFGS
jgi:hypothetical protein